MYTRIGISLGMAGFTQLHKYTFDMNRLSIRFEVNLI